MRFYQLRPRNHLNAYVCRTWSEAEFQANRAQWNNLLAVSDADPLFMSWEWQWHWWKCHHTQLNAELRIAGVYKGNELVALAPLYVHTSRSPIFGASTRIELIGSAWRNPTVAFSEYLDIIVDPSHLDSVEARLADWLFEDSESWEEIVFSYGRPGSAACGLAKRIEARGCFRRSVDAIDAHSLSTTGDFTSYLSELPASTRRRAFNHRRKFDDLRYQLTNPDEICTTLRWCFESTRERFQLDSKYKGVLQFELSLAALMQETHELQLTTLRTGSELISVVFAIRRQGREYYIKSGFRPPRNVRCSPGYLHFGYCIEEAFRENVACYDLLAGQGRVRDYKADFSTCRTELRTNHLVRPRGRALAYKAAHALRSTLSILP